MVSGRALGTALRIGGGIRLIRMVAGRAAGFQPQIIGYGSYGTTQWVRVLARVLLAHPEHGSEISSNTVRGWRAFTGVPLARTNIQIDLGGSTTKAVSDDGGVIDTIIPLTLPVGWHTAVLRAEGMVPAEVRIRVVGTDTTFGIVSDIDDTVMVTAVPRPFLAFWNTFVLSERARSATPGMSVLMDRLVRAHPDAPVMYLSTGPWNAAPALRRFLARNLYPSGTLLLTDWGLTQDRWFRSGIEHKRNNLERLSREFPGVKWLLIGDDGQHDEEIYSEFMTVHPERVAAAAIRQLSASQAVFAGGRSHPGHLSAAAPWIHSPDGAGMTGPLSELGIL